MEEQNHTQGSYLQRLSPGERVEMPLLLTGKELRPFRKRAGNYLILKLRDAGAEIEGKVWEGAEDLAAQLREGYLVRVEGEAVEFRGSLELRVDAAEHPPGADDIHAFVPWVNDYDQVRRDFLALWQEIESDVAPGLRALLRRLFQGEWWERFSHAPAAKFYHHNYVGGLMEHTTRVVRNARVLALNYPETDSTLLLGGAMLHDIGKVEELTMARGGIEYTVEGELLGHILQGMTLLQQNIAGLRQEGQMEFSPELERLLLHIVASHHGEREWGAAQPPRILEAMLVHFADQIDGEAFKYLQARGNPGTLVDSPRLRRNLYVMNQDWEELEEELPF